MSRLGFAGRLARRWRMLMMASLAAAAVVGLGARCIERTNVYVDKDGYTHITGEMVNDTSISGAAIMLRGTLFDDAGNVVATKDSPTCPPDTQPGNQTTFDIRFDNPNVPPFARYDIHAIGGRALAGPLPDSDVVVFSSDAFRFEGVPPIPGLGVTDNDVFFSFSVRNRTANAYTVQGCSAVYDQTGKVVYSNSTELVQRGANGGLEPAVLIDRGGPSRAFMIARDVPKGPVQVRAWLWFGAKGAPTSAYQFVSTGLITIQTDKVN